MNRKEFFKKVFQIGVVAGTASFTGGFEKAFAAANKAVVKNALPDLVAIKGGLPADMFSQGIRALGGMKAFVKAGQTVVIKPNIGWDVTPELAACTNPALVAQIVKESYWAGAKKVIVFDHTSDNWIDTYKNSGIEAAVKAAGGIMAPGNNKDDFKKQIIPGGKTLTSAEVHELFTSCDVLINVPILKHHGTAKMTAAMKNLMGTVWDRPGWHIVGLDKCIAEYPALRKPDLNVIDAYRVMTRNGPRGVSVEDVVEMGSQIISRDIVASDAAAAMIFGAKLDDIAYIKMAHDKGLGNMNLSELNIKKIYL